MRQRIEEKPTTITTVARELGISSFSMYNPGSCYCPSLIGSLVRRKSALVEMWDAYNKDFQRIEGISLIQGETIPPGLFHLVCDILVQHIDGGYLFMQLCVFLYHAGSSLAFGGGIFFAAHSCVYHTKKMPAAYLTSKKPGFMRVCGIPIIPKQKYCKKDAPKSLCKNRKILIPACTKTFA